MQLYEIAVRATGGKTDVMANYLPIMLSQSANNWLMGLREDSIKSWDDLKKVFIENYMATCQQPGTKYDLKTPLDLWGTSAKLHKAFLKNNEHHPQHWGQRGHCSRTDQFIRAQVQ